MAINRESVLKAARATLEAAKKDAATTLRDAQDKYDSLASNYYIATANDWRVFLNNALRKIDAGDPIIPEDFPPGLRGAIHGDGVKVSLFMQDKPKLKEWAFLGDMENLIAFLEASEGPVVAMGDLKAANLDSIYGMIKWRLVK